MGHPQLIGTAETVMESFGWQSASGDPGRPGAQD